MKPTAPLNQVADSRHSLRKLSTPQIGQPTDRPSSTPVSFFLATERDFEIGKEDSIPPRKRAPSIQTVQDAIAEVEAALPLSRRASSNLDHEDPDLRRRRSTIKARSPQTSRRGSSHSNTSSPRAEVRSLPTASQPAFPSQEPSLPSSPDTRSSRSLPRSRASSGAGENSSQAVLSSEDDEPVSSVVQDSAPQLIMPSIKMPSRRPFTQRGKAMGRCKIMVAGAKGGFGAYILLRSLLTNFEAAERRP
jgi:hypothetical protein